MTPIPRLTALTTPAFTLGTTNTAGDALTAVASNSTLLTFDAVDPAAVAAAAVVGSATVSSRRDHVHVGPVVATQAQLETASDTATFASPGRMQYAPTSTKAWGQIAADGESIMSSYGVASVADTATGNRRVNLTTAFSSTAFCIVMGLDGANESTRFSINSETQFDYLIYNSSGSLTDSQCAFATMGDY